MTAREPATRGEARPSSDLVEGIARAIYEQRPVLSSGPAMSWSTLVALKDNDQCIAVLRRHREGAQAALEYISSLGMVVVPSSVLTPQVDSAVTSDLAAALEILSGPVEHGEHMTGVENESPVTIRCQLGDLRRAWVALQNAREERPGGEAPNNTPKVRG